MKQNVLYRDRQTPTTQLHHGCSLPFIGVPPKGPVGPWCYPEGPVCQCRNLVSTFSHYTQGEAKGASSYRAGGAVSWQLRIGHLSSKGVVGSHTTQRHAPGLTPGWFERPFYNEMGDDGRDGTPGHEAASRTGFTLNGKAPQGKPLFRATMGMTRTASRLRRARTPRLLWKVSADA